VTSRNNLRQARNDLDWLSSTRQGRRVLYRLIVEMCGCLDTPRLGDFAAGRESVGHEFLGLLAYHWPDRLALLLSENRPAGNDYRSDDASDTDDTDATEFGTVDSTASA
jgi:hypothetical protein